MTDEGDELVVSNYITRMPSQFRLEVATFVARAENENHIVCGSLVDVFSSRYYISKFVAFELFYF